MAVSSPSSAPGRVRVIRPEFRGASLELFRSKEEECVIAGAAGTGKTVGICHYLHGVALKYPKAQIFMARKTLTALTTGAIKTYERQVLDSADGVSYFGGSSREPACYRYPNGSRIVIGGLDKASKALSSEYDIIYVNECTEIELADWEILSTRLRNGIVPYQRLLGDCNPDAPSHWIKVRAAEGKLRLLTSVHEDNPGYYDVRTGQWTEKGAAYIKRLESLTGVRYKRYRLGQWVAAEGAIYEEFNRAIHVLKRPADWAVKTKAWRRIWTVDFGFRDPFVWQCWAIDHDGRMWLEYEIFRTETLVEDHAREILRVTGYQWHNGRMQAVRPDATPLPQAIICDHDAEDRATLERHLHAPTVAAYKAISPGIQLVQSLLKPAANGTVGIVLLDDALQGVDEALMESKAPLWTGDEFESYVWDPNIWNPKTGVLRGEKPLDKHNHGMDAMRYGAAWVHGLATKTVKKKFGVA